MYEKHSVRLDIAGTVDSISKITDDILYKCYNTFYNLNNMALCVSGDISVEQVKKIADKILKKAGPSDIERFDYKEPYGVKTHKTEKSLKVSKPLFCIGLKDDETGFDGDALAKKTYELAILNEMIFSRASDFYTRLYNEGKINNKFYASFEDHPQYCYMLYGGESERAEEVYDDIIAEYEDKLKTGLDKKEFERSKRVVYADFIKAFDNTSNIANSLIGCLFKGYDILDIPQIIASITFEDICDRMKKIFKKDNFIISIVNPID
jgi:predicted Zn-dependent peptidase